MDAELSAAKAHLHLALNCMHLRQRRLDKTRSKMSRHYSKVAHTSATILLLSQVIDLFLSDPDTWDDEPGHEPF